MPISPDTPIPADTPVLIGWSQVHRRESDYRQALEPVDLMAEAARTAVPSGALRDLDWIGATAGLTRYADPARLVAVRLGSDHAHTVLAKIGVLQHSLVSAACQAVQSGRYRLALVVGGEARYREVRAAAEGESAPVTVQPDSVRPDTTMSSETFDTNMFHPVEAQAGLAQAPPYYALIDSFWRSSMGYTLDDHRDRIAGLYARFSEIASHNPHAVRPRHYSPEFLRDSSADNPMVAFPYTKFMVTTWTVDEACALFFTTAATAAELGVPREQWRFPVIAVESNYSAPVAARAQLHTPSSMRGIDAVITERTGLAPADIEALDLYSALPAPVLIGAHALGVDDDRDLTVTGGMSFAGGPLNNYAFHAVAAIADRLSDPEISSGLVSCVSGYYTKQGVLVFTTNPPEAPFELVDITDTVAASEAVYDVVAAEAGRGSVVAYTVVHAGGAPQHAVAIIDLTDGTRTVACNDDPHLMASAMTEDLIGAPVTFRNGQFQRID